MNSRKGYRLSLEAALANARAGDPDEALKDLRNGIGKALEIHDRRGASILARNAAIISSAQGDYKSSVSFYQLAAEHDPEDAYLFLALAGEFERLGDEGSRQSSLRRCYQLGVSSSDDEILELLTSRGFSPDPAE